MAWSYRCDDGRHALIARRRFRNTSLSHALKRERVVAGAQRRRPGEGRTSDHACKILTPHRFAMGPPLPLLSAGEG